MANVAKIKFWLILSVLWFGISAFTVPENMHEAENQTLFKIGRSKDINEIWYTPNINENGTINQENPVNVFWVKKNEQNKTEPLSLIQKKYAYGIKYLKITKDQAVFQFVSYSKRNFTLKKNSKGDYRVFYSQKGRELELSKIYIQITGGSFWFPKIKQVEIYYTNPENQKTEVEILIP